MKEAGYFFIGLDVGGTKTAGGIVDVRSGNVLHAVEAQTARGNDGRQNLDVVRRMTDGLKQRAQAAALEITGVGIGICEIVDAEGNLRSSSLIDWRGIDLAAFLNLAEPPHLVSDVRAAALAESSFGSAQSVRHVLFVSIGTGIASAYVIDGMPYAGAHGAALVLASAPRRSLCLQCGKETRARLEDIASGPALARQFSGVGDGDARPLLHAAKQGDAKAMALLRHAALHLSDAIGQLANCLDPEMIVIGGGLGSAPGPYWEELRSSIRESLWSGMDREITIKQASLGTNAGLIGAALATAQRLH